MMAAGDALEDMYFLLLPLLDDPKVHKSDRASIISLAEHDGIVMGLERIMMRVVDDKLDLDEDVYEKYVEYARIFYGTFSNEWEEIVAPLIEYMESRKA